MINTDKAYLFGLIVGGGSFGESHDAFAINLPYDKWGDVRQNPIRASKISQDIARVVAPILHNDYGLLASYSSDSKEWQITISGDYSRLSNDLAEYGIQLSKTMRKSADISHLCKALSNDVLRRRFLAGLADTVGSTNPNHRRFSDDVQIVSFEFSGFNYRLVFEVCKLFASTGCYADQILWNHPNMHSSLDPYYASWKKGFKLRVPLDEYTESVGFSFQSKTISSRENQIKEQKGKIHSVPCSQKAIVANCSVVHPDEDYFQLPDEIRGGHYLHHKHFCAVLGCPFAPYEEIDGLISNAGNFISPFPILFKGTTAEIQNAISNDPFLRNCEYSFTEVDLSDFVSALLSNKDGLLFGNGRNSGYPAGKILDGINYLIQANSNTLKGKRTSGVREVVIREYLSNHSCASLRLGVPDKLSALVLSTSSGSFSAMVGSRNPEVYQKLVTRDPKNKYKLCVRQISDDDFK